MFPLASAVPVRTPPLVVWSLIAINAIVFLFEISLPPAAQERFLYEWALVPARYFVPEWAIRVGLDPTNPLPFLTNMFLHGGWLHIIFNMWTLWIFGPAVEDRLGKLRFLAFYLLCGLGASLAHAYVNADSTIPALGASGAIAGVIGAYMRLFPLARVIVMVPVLFFPFFFEMYAYLFALIWFLIQLFQGVGSLLAADGAGGVAWWAHIGGFIYGWLLVKPAQQPAARKRPYFADECKLGFCPDGSRRNIR